MDADLPGMLSLVRHAQRELQAAGETRASSRLREIADKAILFDQLAFLLLDTLPSLEEIVLGKGSRFGSPERVVAALRELKATRLGEYFYSAKNGEYLGIAGDLAEAGFSPEGAELRDAVLAGGTGLEIGYAVCSVLRTALEKQEGRIPDDLRHRMALVVERLTRHLEDQWTGADPDGRSPALTRASP
jgi:hypothetical protein